MHLSVSKMLLSALKSLSNHLLFTLDPALFSNRIKYGICPIDAVRKSVKGGHILCSKCVNNAEADPDGSISESNELERQETLETKRQLKRDQAKTRLIICMLYTSLHCLNSHADSLLHSQDGECQEEEGSARHHE